MLKIRQLSRVPLHEAISEKLRGLIVDGTLPPGHKLPERELCESFGVSRTPMREAIHSLAGEGLITLTPNRGAHVARIDPAQLISAFEVMEALETAAGHLAAARITAKAVEQIHDHHGQMLGHYRDGELTPYFKHNRAIHDIIFAATQNDVLCEMRNQVLARSVSLRFSAELDADEWALAISEHEEMLVALDARDGAQLSEILGRHTRSKRDQVTHWLASRAKQTPQETT